MKTAIAYVRVSTTEQVSEGVSLDAQEERIRAYCTMAGLDLAEVIREEGVSGAVPLSERPAGARLLTCAALCRFIASNNTATAMGRMFLTMMAGFAELERNLISERTAAAMQHKKGRREVYSPTPLGFDRTADDRLAANEEEQEIVRLVMRHRKRGDAMNVIASKLNAAGVKGKKGGRFHASTVRRILTNSLHTAA